jgi:hypothetical protein
VTFRAVDLFATATGAAARCCQRRLGLWIVGLLHSPSLPFQRRRMMAPGSFEGLPALARLGSGRPMLSPHGLRLSFGDSVRLVPPWLVSSDCSGLAASAVVRFLSLGSSHGVVKVRPSIGMGARCPLRWSAAPRSCRASVPEGTSVRRGATPARSCQAPDSFRPCRSSRLRRFAPPGTFQVCCTLKPILGFATFQALGAGSLLGRSRRVDEPPFGRAATFASPKGRSGRPLPRGPGALAPEGASALVASRRGELAAASNLSPRRKTLRSFSLTDSRSASTGPAGPYPDRRFLLGEPSRLRRPGRGSACGSGPPRLLPSRRCSSRGVTSSPRCRPKPGSGLGSRRCCALPRSPDLKALLRR